MYPGQPHVTSSQESPAPRTLVILPQGASYQLTPRGSLAPVHLPRNRPLAPKPFASAAFYRTPHAPITSRYLPFSYPVKDVLKVPTPSIGSPTISSSKPPNDNAVSSAISDTFYGDFKTFQSSKLGFSSQAFKPPATPLHVPESSTADYPIVTSTFSISTTKRRKTPCSAEKSYYSSNWTRRHVSWLVKNSKYCLNRMHVMEGDGDKVGEMVAESAPELVTAANTTDIKLVKEVLSLPAVEKIQEPEAPSLPEQPVKSAADSTPSENDEKEKDKTELKTLLVNGDSNTEVNKVSGSENSGEVNADTSKADVNEDVCMENGSVEDKEEEKEDAKESVKEDLIPATVEVKESGSGAVSEEEDRQSVTSSQGRKRAALPEGEAENENEGSSSESDGGANKRPRMENDDGEDERERLVREYVDECTESMDEMNRAADKLQREIGALGELLRTKELEWNSILRLRKLKEEMLERLLRRRRLSTMMTENGVREEYVVDKEREKMKNTKVINLNTTPVNGPSQLNNGGLMMVPVVSSSPSPSPGPPRSMQSGLQQPPRGAPRPMQRPILPKPMHPQHPQHPHDPVGEGRQGAILDVKSIIADYRSRHPENVPRRGRRMRPNEGGPGLMRSMMDTQGNVVSSTRISGSPALMSMANMALGSGSHVRENPNAPSYMGGGETSRPSSADSSRSNHHLELLPAPGVSFKDALVQFAKMSQPPKPPPPPPPPYPEVTLHPVSPPPPPPPPPQHSQSHSSLLHGILTKSQANSMMAAVPPQPHRATTFSPTLARLLTAPERGAPVPPTPHFRPRVNITDILSSSKKNRNEITITPVAGSNKTKEDVVMLQDDEEEGDGDRLVIDEGRDTAASSGANPAGGRELPENVPECQGCHQRSAQFVCAGCGNQWYCSRECQVTAWEEHSEMCSG